MDKFETIVWFYLEKEPEYNRTIKFTFENFTDLFNKIIKNKMPNELYRFDFVNAKN